LGGQGAPGAYVTIQAYDGDLTAVLQGDSGSADVVCFHGRQYSKLIGFELTGEASSALVHGDANDRGIGDCQYIYVQRCYAHDAPDGADCMHFNGQYIFVEDCEVSKPGPRSGAGYQECIDYVDVHYGAMRGNYCHDFNDMALYSKGGSLDTIIEGNVISGQLTTNTDNPATAFGQQTDARVLKDDTHQSYNTVYRNNIIRDAPRGAIGTYDCYHAYFYNNVVYNCGSTNYGIVHQRTSTSFSTGSDGVYFFNNVFLDTAGDMWTVYQQRSSPYYDWQTGNNNYYNAGNPIPSAGIVDPNQEAGATFGNPNLANPTGTATTYAGWLNCYRITASSAALIDQGNSNAGNDPQPGVHDDIEGTARPQGGGWDIGAFEYPSGPVPPAANFSGNPTSGYVPLTVAFTDLSSGSPTSWDWTFGDSGTSQAQHPSHEYTAVNSYTVSLTAANAQGQDTETKPGHITVSDQPDQSCHVGAIDMANGGTPVYKAAATITVHDQACAPLAGVTVAITWSGAAQGTDSGVTNDSGQVTFTSGRNKSGGTFTCTVNNLTKSGYPYQSADNHETSDSITLP
jgi:PKD repeat protein